MSNGETALEKLEWMKKEEERLKGMGGAERIEEQHGRGKYTARERIEKLYDPGTFLEIGLWCKSESLAYDLYKREIPADGVIAGYGNINGWPVYGFFQDFTVMGGTLGRRHAEKMSRVLDEAAKAGCPVLYVADSGGARIQEGVDALSGYGDMFYRNTLYSGVIPQLCAIVGPCAGGAVYSPALMDCIFTVDKITQAFITGPGVVKAVLAEEVEPEELGGARVNCEKSGNGTFFAKDEDECIEQIKTLLSYLPSNNREKPPRVETHDPQDRIEPKLREIVPARSTAPYDMKQVLRLVVDNGVIFEWQARFARNIITCFARMNGDTVGIIANQPMHLAGSLDIDCCDKASRFIRFCDAFNISVLNFVDVPGYLPGTQQEWGGIIRHGAKMLYAYSEATVSKITIITRKAYGGSYLGMCSKDLGADIVFAWPTAEMAVMGPEGAVNVIEAKTIKEAEDPAQKRAELIREYKERFANPYLPASKLHIDAIIDPAETRFHVCRALKLFWGKEVKLPAKKHGIMPT
ncbi:MAG: methylmalonyl-CoA carboxyltransferase [Chloroflexi bacterium CG15_BIG_FIL_POST_REV_8_21_14_020_46_15]|nr:MAG: methylmalonyl-CoA carboxyltransferase [Dehalococcoidia bacterium CG2_30_46_19]PIW40225.1 MAG: methylmalonyl-CoA carboxyltransferase [Chloroflexi bacterium CG15_BIG_FIL_POST_REV_8_21_14_020_46_15]